MSALAWILEEKNLNQALDAALKFASNVCLVHGVATAMQVNDSSVTLQLDNGDKLTSTLLIGADGRHSWVRGQCDIGLDYRPYAQRALVSNFDCELPHHGIAYQWFTVNEGIIALLPLPGQRVSLVWSAPETLASVLVDHIPQDQCAAQLAERLVPYAEKSLGRLTPLQPEVVRNFPLVLMKPHSVISSRVILIGDAAHVVHPLAGHGMNLGFSDVSTLVKVLAGCTTGNDCGDPRILRRYARARKEEVLLMQLATDGLARLFDTDIEPVRLIRNVGLNLMNHLPVLKRYLMTHASGNH